MAGEHICVVPFFQQFLKQQIFYEISAGCMRSLGVQIPDNWKFTAYRKYNNLD
jgi:hypothetical protein